MEDQEFKVGERVRLKSGGPDMTVTSARSEGGFVGVAWFRLPYDGSGMQREKLPPEALDRLPRL